jgi:hypothetical protein
MALLALIAILALPAPTLTADSNTSTAPTTSSARPTLKLVRIDPLTVAGRGFKRSERVIVTANGRRKAVVAGVNGGFTISFRGVGSCGAQIVARGSAGSRAKASLNFSNVHCLEP